LTTAKTAELFFRICQRYDIKRRENRVCLMRELTRRKKAKYIRDVAPLIANKKVIRVGLKSHNAGPEHWCYQCCPDGPPIGDIL